MTYDEYESKINEVLGNPDTALANIAPIMSAIKDDITALEAAKSENESLSARIKDLQETNIKLYLAQTGKSDVDQTGGDDDEEPKTGMDAAEDFLSNVFKEEEE